MIAGFVFGLFGLFGERWPRELLMITDDMVAIDDDAVILEQHEVKNESCKSSGLER